MHGKIFLNLHNSNSADLTLFDGEIIFDKFNFLIGNTKKDSCQIVLSVSKTSTENPSFMWIQQIILLVLTSQAIYYVGLLFQCLLLYKSPTYFHVYATHSSK